MKLKWMIVGATVLLAIPQTRKLVLEKLASLADLVDAFSKETVKTAKTAARE